MAQALGVKGGLLNFSPSGAVMKSAQADKVQSTDSAPHSLNPHPHHKSNVHLLSVTNKDIE